MPIKRTKPSPIAQLASGKNAMAEEMSRVDRLPADQWLEHADQLAPDEVQKEILRQTTDTKLQLVTILNHLQLLMVFLFILLFLILYRVW